MNNTKIPVIYYHSVGPRKPDWVRKHLTLELDFFEDQMQKFAKSYTTITLKEYWEAINGLRDIPKNAIVITFDDGYLDNWVWAFPYLKKYNLKATIFVSPEFVDKKSSIREMADINKPFEAQQNRLDNWGYLNWDEMREMEKSGLVDIQSHTMSHTMYFVSENLIGFKHPSADVLYPVGNLYSDKKPYYINNESFNQLIPNGYPFFEQSSAIIAKRIWINEDFNNECIDILKKHNWKSATASAEAFKKVKNTYNTYLDNNSLIVKKETKDEYEKRVLYEVIDSKEIIEKELNKKVEFLCWPHGDNNEFAHKVAIDAGYLATTLGKFVGNYSPQERIEARTGTDALRNNVLLTTNRMLFNMQVYKKRFPYFQIKELYAQFKKFSK